MLGSSSYFGAVSGVVAFISMVSRRSTSRSVAAVACFVAAFAIDTIFNPYMSWDEIGWFGAIFVVVVMVFVLVVMMFMIVVVIVMVFTVIVIMVVLMFMVVVVMVNERFLSKLVNYKV